MRFSAGHNNLNVKKFVGEIACFARRSALAALQILPDGGLVRSTRIARLEAALLIAEGAVPARKLATVARLIDVKEVQQFVQVLNESYDRTRSAFRIEQTAAGYILMTRAAAFTVA